MKNTIKHLIELLFPRTCVHCQRKLHLTEEVFCTECLLEIPYISYSENVTQNPAKKLFDGQIPFVRATAFAHFQKDGLLQSAIHALKYGGQQKIGIFLGRMVAQSLVHHRFLEGVDLLIPIPLHRKRQKERGYNQAEIIAEGIAQEAKIPIRSDLLIRCVNNQSQTKMSAEERRHNVHGIFELTNPQALAGKHILLIDDVLTTGSTIEEASRVLLKTNGLRISLLTIGIAGAGK